MAAPYPGSGGGSEVKCVGGRGASVPWDFLPGLMVKAPSGPWGSLQAGRRGTSGSRRNGELELQCPGGYGVGTRGIRRPGHLVPACRVNPGGVLGQKLWRLRLGLGLGLARRGLQGGSCGRGAVAPSQGNRLQIRGVKTPVMGLGGGSPGQRAPGAGAASSFHLPPAPGRRGPAALVSEVFEQHLGGHILQSLDGFVFALNQEGKFLYISETVSIYLGLSQVEMTGSSVFDYIHPGDHSEVLEQLGLRTPTPGPPTPPSVSSSSSSSSSSLADTPEIEASLTKVPPSSLVQERSFFVRMKSTLTKRGLHVKASGYKVIHVTGRLRAHALGLVALGHTLPPAPLAELPLHGHMIVFRLSLGLTILACESRVSDHMDLGPSELVGRSCYQFVHGQDATRIRQSHVDLLDKGQVMTGYYRWLQRAGGFVWLQSVATVAGSGKSPGEHHVLWVSHVLR
ncbi:PREDICTED: neuronal PAS domain-containing protein 1 [Mandrillus leucophaeus]|uniref:neuronal PAS domain-containing protein 1 n=1 Tax=Mandrillus leucophaeus TaxID=9568 RepID=UPI0005F48C55|nr:PREDICTED: neuronal PAS domain-containing protein 1 [Mandrillus leucophaeus]